jgi:hypothetical protein
LIEIRGTSNKGRRIPERTDGRRLMISEHTVPKTPRARRFCFVIDQVPIAGSARAFKMFKYEEITAPFDSGDANRKGVSLHECLLAY